MRPDAPAMLPILRSRLLGQLLALLAADEERWWTIDQLASRTGGAYPTVTREVRRLAEADLIETEEIGRTKRVRSNAASPFHRPLAELMLRAFGPLVVVGEEFGHLAGVDQVAIYGSWAARYEGETGPAPNDIDVLVLGEPDRDDVHDAARRAEHRLGLPVNTTIRRSEAWVRADDPFARQLKASPMVVTASKSNKED